MARTQSDKLLSEIQSGALQPDKDLPTLLRKCVALGGVTGSETLRQWATSELKGYGPDDEVPAYREAAAPLLLDGTTRSAIVKGQTVPLTMIPDFARDKVTNDIVFRQPIAEILDMQRSAQINSDRTVNLGPPGSGELVALINHQMAKDEEDHYLGYGSPSQVVERIYWSVSLTTIARVLDVVRTTLVELVAEMRAGTPSGQGKPSSEVAEQAAQVAIYGNRNRVVVNHMSSVEAGGNINVGSSADPESETLQRAVMWWIVGIATIVAAAAAVWVLFI